MSKIVVTVKHTIPLMDYGNTIYEATQERDISEGDDIDLWTQSTLEDVRAALSAEILPLVNSEVERCAEALAKEVKAGNDPDVWMRRNAKVYQWFRLAYPDIEIPAMQQLELAKRLAKVMDKMEVLAKYGEVAGEPSHHQWEDTDKFPGMADDLPGQ